MAKFCKNCGATMENEMVFCSKCGIRQDPAPDATVLLGSGGSQRPAGPDLPPRASAPNIPPRPSVSNVPPRPSAPAYPAAPAVRVGDTGRGGGWIMFLRILLWFVFSAVCLTGAYLAAEAFRFDQMAALSILAVSVLLAFTLVAGGMVALDSAQNIRRCAINSANILDLLNQRLH